MLFILCCTEIFAFLATLYNSFGSKVRIFHMYCHHHHHHHNHNQYLVIMIDIVISFVVIVIITIIVIIAITILSPLLLMFFASHS